MTASQNSVLRLGIVGAGMIAGVVASAVKAVENIQLTAVASRRRATAEEFAKTYAVATVFESWQEMLASPSIDAVYIATPTHVKEDIAIYAAQHKKHLLVDKPFASADSVQRMLDAAKANDVAFMDATHFSNHPRTQAIRDAMPTTIGSPQAVKTSFFFPFMDKENIRFNPEKEPTGAVGDTAWYSMRAIAEYLQPTASIKTVSGAIMRDPDSNAIVRGTGVIVFADDKSSTFDFGYSAGVCLMELDILGETGMFNVNDFVLDWKDGFAFDNPNHSTGYTHRTAMDQPQDFKFVATPAEQPQAVSMMRNFAELTNHPNSASAQRAASLTLLTQSLLDAYWEVVK